MTQKEIPSIDKETAKAITTAVKLYFRNQGISHKEVADRLGYSSASVVHNHLSYGRFGKRMAEKWAKEFGFNKRYLLTGKGRLVERQSGYQKLVRENESLKAIIRIQKNMLQEMSVGEQIGIDRKESLQQANEKIDKLQKENAALRRMLEAYQGMYPDTKMN